MDPTTYFYLTNFTGILITGGLIFLIGLAVAWLLWRNCGAEANASDEMGSGLRSELEGLRKEVEQLESERP